MKILISNDDGFRADGIVALYTALKGIADVEVVAPEHNNSAKSNALTLHTPLYVNRADNGFRYVNGTPADCVHIALTGLLAHKPDLVVSGINNGQNMGDDTLYSGTVAAAMEGYLFGIPSLAFSHVDKGHAHLDAAARVAADLVERFARRPLSGAWLLNVNIPNLPYADLRGATTTRLGKRHASEPVIQTTNPRGETIYWIGPAGAARDAGPGTDFHAVAAGQVSVTPLQIDLTHGAQLEPLSAWLEAAAA